MIEYEFRGEDEPDGCFRATRITSDAITMRLIASRCNNMRKFFTILPAASHGLLCSEIY